MSPASAARTSRSSLTGALVSTTDTLVRSVLTLLTALALLMTLALGPAAHASIPVPCGKATASATDVHFEGDADEVPADEDAGFPHHHGPSHDHQVGTALEGVEAAALVMGPSPRWARASAAYVASDSDPALRPPRA